jgi:hypothetical protein
MSHISAIAKTPTVEVAVRRSSMSPAYYLGRPAQLWIDALSRHGEGPATPRLDEGALKRRPAA